MVQKSMVLKYLKANRFVFDKPSTIELGGAKLTQRISIPVSRLSVIEAIRKLDMALENTNVRVFYNATSMLGGNIEILIDEPSAVKQAKGYGSSKYRGVFWVKREQRWRAQFSYKGKRYTIGRYDNEIDAAKAYDQKAFEMMGADAYLNFPMEVTK